MLEAVRQSESEMLKYIVLFLIYTGARKREELDAKWQDIDWDKQSWHNPKTKARKVRHVPLSKHATFLVNAGRSLYEVRELLGHSDIRTTSRCAHLNRERLIFAV